MRKWLGPGSLKERVLFGDFGGAQWKRNLIVRMFCWYVLRWNVSAELLCSTERIALQQRGN